MVGAVLVASISQDAGGSFTLVQPYELGSPLTDYPKELKQLLNAEQLSRDSRELDVRRTAYRTLKRAFDIVVSGAVILVGLLPSAILCALIWWSTNGSPIYSQTRVGLYGRPFRIYKFRTMVADSDNVEKYFTSEQLARWQRERKVDDDPRITRLGKFLRTTSIDEIPNFINVFIGQMSTVGPRAISEDELRWYGRDAKKLLSVTPGVTGWWQVTARNSATYESGDRQQSELHYIDQSSVWVDIRILALTLKTIVQGTGK